MDAGAMPRGEHSEQGEVSAVLGLLAADITWRYPNQLEAAVYFCCTEALQNIAKHAGHDARAHITLAQRDEVLRFEVSDDGCGFVSTTTPPSGGLQNMTDVSEQSEAHSR